MTQHIPLSEAKAGIWSFPFYLQRWNLHHPCGGYMWGNNRMYHAGNPIGYADLTGSYWQQHLAGAGRIKKIRKDDLI